MNVQAGDDLAPVCVDMYTIMHRIETHGEGVTVRERCVIYCFKQLRQQMMCKSLTSPMGALSSRNVSFFCTSKNTSTENIALLFLKWQIFLGAGL